MVKRRVQDSSDDAIDWWCHVLTGRAYVVLYNCVEPKLRPEKIVPVFLTEPS